MTIEHAGGPGEPLAATRVDTLAAAAATTPAVAAPVASTATDAAAVDGTPSPARSGPTLGHVPALDGLRGLAVLLVVALHLGFVVDNRHSIVPGGAIGVDVFFVLSGFLITALLLGERSRTGGVSFRRFYLRRALRLLPALVVVVAAHVAYTVVAGDPLGPEVKSAAAILVYVGNWVQTTKHYVPEGLKHMWSLGVEEQFYLVWPAIAMLLLRRYGRQPKRLAAVLVAAIVASCCIRIWLWTNVGYPAAYVRTDARFDGLLIGAGVAFLWHRGALPHRAIRTAATAGLAALLLFSLFDVQLGSSFYYYAATPIALGVAAMIVAILQGGWVVAPVLASTPLRTLGRVSYGLYLWHVPITVAVQRHLHLPAWELVLVAAALSAIATTASWFVVEQPFLRLKDRRAQAS